MSAVLNWQLELNSRMIRGGVFVAVSARRVVDGRLVIELVDELSQETAAFAVHSNINIGGKNYLMLQAFCAAGDGSFVVVRLFDKKRICAMDADRFSSLKNAFLMSLESGERSSLQDLENIV